MEFHFRVFCHACLIGSVALLSLAASPTLAKDKLYTPYVDQGEWELEYFGRHSVDDDDSKNAEQKHAIAVGYGVTDVWKTELYTIFEKEAGDHVVFDAVEWENIFQFTEQGKYWADVGASLAYEWTPEGDRADAVEARLLFAKTYGKSFHVLNLIAEQTVGNNSDEGLEGALLWSSRYHCSEHFQPGFEISSSFGELEDTGSFDDQEHYIGPVAYGEVPLPFAGEEEEEGLHYRVGYLFGVSDAASDGQVILQLEYELEF